MQTEAFSHRLKIGVSIGVRTIDERQFQVALTFQNSCDQSNRREAVAVLRKRLNSSLTKEKGAVRLNGTYTLSQPTHMSDFMHALRSVFKPDPLENQSDKLSSESSRQRQSRIIFEEMIPSVLETLAEGVFKQ